MTSQKIVLDVETQREFAEVGGRENVSELGVSLVGVYDYPTHRFLTFEEQELPALESLLKERDHLIGFNIRSFDFPVLQPYFSDVQFQNLMTTDIMDDVTAALGYRLSLNNLAEATLRARKSGHGLQAIQWYREGEIDELKRYCLDDVRLTHDLYEHGLQYGYILSRLTDYPYHFEEGGLREEHAIPVACARKVDLHLVKSAVKESLEKGMLIKIDYVSSRAEHEKEYRRWRLVEVKEMGSDWFKGYCFFRKEDRQFKFSRILDLKIA